MHQITLIFITYKNLILQSTLTLTVTLLFHFLPFFLPSLFLHGLNTYIHPDDVTSQPKSSSLPSPKLAIRRPNVEDSESNQIRNRKKKNDKKLTKFEFDESNAQIFRLRLGDAQLVSRLHFDGFGACFNCVFLGCSCFLLNLFLDNVEEGSGVLRSGALVPVLVGVLSLFRVFVVIFRVSMEGSAFRRSEKQLGMIVGVIGFAVGFVVVSGGFRSVLDFEFDGVDGYGSLVVAGLCGCVAGFLCVAAGKNARAFWLGTDQIRCNLSIVSCPWLSRMVLYASCLGMVFTSLLWINPFAELLVNENIGGDKSSARMINGAERSEKLVGHVGIARTDFVRFRIWSLLASGVLQALSVRPNLQMYLNEAVLSWYQRLHASRVPDLEYSRAKVFLHNHFMCVAVQQFFAPAALVLLFLGLSQLHGGIFVNLNVVCGILACSVFVGEVGILMAWWVTFVWSICTLVYLSLYRRGILYVS